MVFFISFLILILISIISLQEATNILKLYLCPLLFFVFISLVFTNVLCCLPHPRKPNNTITLHKNFSHCHPYLCSRHNEYFNLLLSFLILFLFLFSSTNSLSIHHYLFFHLILLPISLCSLIKTNLCSAQQVTHLFNSLS